MEDRVVEADIYEKSPDRGDGATNPAPDAAKQQHREYLDYFEVAQEVTLDSDLRNARSRDYYDGVQYTAKELEEYKERKQPALVFNHVKRKINFLIGYEDEQRGDPKAFPRNVEADDDAAHAATDALRYSADKAKFADADGYAFEDLVIEGIGAIELGMDMATKNIKVSHWKWDRVFYDPFSARPDFSDALYVGGIIWMDRTRAYQRYPNKRSIIDMTAANEESDRVSLQDKYRDKPRERVWADLSKTRVRIRVVQIYCKHGDGWKWAHFTGAGFLEDPQDVPYVDDEGKSYCPLLLQSCYVSRDNERYGEARDLLDTQDEINKRRSKILHLSSVRQLAIPRGAVDNVAETRKEFAKPDGVIEYDPVSEAKVEVLDTSDMLEAQVRLLEHAQKEMETQGPNSALQGKQGKDASGRAIIASQQGGLLEHRRTFKRQKTLRLRAYTIMWWMIKQFWDEEKWIRVTDEEKNARFVGFNVKTTVRELAMQDADREIKDISEREMVKQGLMNANDPELDKPTIVNDISEMHMDIELDESQDSVVIQSEQFEEVIKLAAAGVPFMPEDIIELSQLKNKDKVLERMRARAEAATGGDPATGQPPGGAPGSSQPGAAPPTDPRVDEANAAAAASKAAQQDLKTQREQVGLAKDLQPEPAPAPTQK